MALKPTNRDPNAIEEARRQMQQSKYHEEPTRIIVPRALRLERDGKQNH